MLPFRYLVVLFTFAIADPAFADCQGQFLPIAGDGSPFEQVHFVPKNGNRIVVGGVEEIIPAGVGVQSGGVIGDIKNACIDKVCGQQLAPLTLYRVYVFMDQGTMKLDFSGGGHRADPTTGHEVHVDDPTRSLVGMVWTDEEGRVRGEAARQQTISWCNRGHTALALHFGLYTNIPAPKTCSDVLAPVPGIELEFLTFGINDAFRQAFTVPNVYVTGSVVTDNIGGHAWVGVGINGSLGSSIASWHSDSDGDAGTVFAAALGAAGAEEGRVTGQLMMSNGGLGGCASLPSGTLFTSPLHS